MPRVRKIKRQVLAEKAKNRPQMSGQGTEKRQGQRERYDPGVEANIVERHAIAGRRAGHNMRGVKDELPLALPKEQPDSEVNGSQ